MVPDIQIVGAGPAGSAAAIGAYSCGAGVRIVERARFARHKVCGEFLPVEACAELERLGVWQDVLRSSPPLIRRCVLHFGSRRKQWKFDDPGRGLSRLLLDRLLLDRAGALGADIRRGTAWNPDAALPGAATILACGRRGTGGGRPRLFGFKSHFSGPAEDIVELYFTSWGYCGVSPIEGGLTNICGLAPENILRRANFDIDELLAAEPELSRRTRWLTRHMPWLKTGPLCFTRSIGADRGGATVYRAGDALGFVDPFTGSGILHALLTGRLAGEAAARGVPNAEYVRQCAALLNRPFATSRIFRTLVGAGLSRLALLVPGQLLYRLTRAEVADA
jgi:hypothetical protein